MQAILTKYLPPTNHRGQRVAASCDARRITVPWDYALGISENHAVAARILAQRLGWLSGFRLESGSLPGGSYCHVLVAESPGALASEALNRRMRAEPVR